MNILLCVSYEGTYYNGFQTQKNKHSVQDAIESALETIYKKKIRIISAGRTDAGVHAERTYVNFQVDYSIVPAEKLSYVVNKELPNDIVVLYSREIDTSFHARYSAVKRWYYYQFYVGKIVPSIYRLYAVGVDPKLDFDMLCEEAQALVGIHDFYSFTVQIQQQRSTVRQVFDIFIKKYEHNIIRFYISANAFLWKMIRSIIGTLLQNAYGRIHERHIPYSIQDILNAKDNSLCATIAPAKGLFLYNVEYKELET